MDRYPGNHVDSGIVTVPRKLKTRPGAPETHLAYITPDEEKILQQYKPGTPHRGPEEIPNYDTWAWDGSSGSSVTGGSTADAGSGSGGGGSGTGSYSWETSSNPWGNDYQEPYTPPEEVYKDPLPEDIGGSDYKIADYSFSTPDVRASVLDRQAFRERTGSTVMTNSEKLAYLMYDITNNPNYLNQPIFVPDNADWHQIQGLIQQAQNANDPKILFQGLKNLEDITHGNANLEYFDSVSGTTWKDWWKRPSTTTGGGGGGGGGGRGWGSGSGWGSSQYNNPYGRYSKRNWMYKNRDADSQIARILAQKEANKYNNLPKNQWMFTQMLQSMPGGGITEAI